MIDLGQVSLDNVNEKGQSHQRNQTADYQQHYRDHILRKAEIARVRNNKIVKLFSSQTTKYIK